MKLKNEQIEECVSGAVRIEKEDERLKLFRFTSEQEALYRSVNKDFYQTSLATAGIKMIFQTNSHTLFLKVFVTRATSRRYFSFDVYVDGQPIGYLDNYSDRELGNRDYMWADYPLGEFSKKFDLGAGIKTVCVYFPWSVNVAIQDITLDDDAFAVPVKMKKKLVAYGDSITQGYDALRPSARYIAKVAESLGAEEINKAIGGECFFPELVKTGEGFIPDYVTVAYGTNDWNKLEAKAFQSNCKEFYNIISRTYHCSKIFAISPIWRIEFEESRKAGTFSDIEKYIREVTEPLNNITFISGFDLVPKDEECFGDNVHPNEIGLGYYFRNLWDKIQENGVGL